MFHLMESKVQRAKHPATIAVSASLHATVVAAAVLATADTRIARAPAVEVFRLIPPRAEASETRERSKPATPARVQPKVTVAPTAHVAPTEIAPISEVPVGVTPAVAADGTGSVGPDAAVDATGSGELGSEGEPFTQEAVERAARLKSRPVVPVYPDALRRSGVEGMVVVRFVVDTTGRVERSIETVQATHDLFLTAVKAALARTRFEPAMVRGRPVRQVMEQPFLFRIER